MKKRENGILTVEASIVLTLMTLFMLFLFSFIRVYRAENVVSHATLQAADALALESYLRENAMDDQAEDVVFLANRLTGGDTALDKTSFESLRSANLTKLAKEKFTAALADTEENADRILKIYGVKDGLAGVDFSSSTMDLDRDDVIVSASYTLKIQFPLFTGKTLSVTKTAKAKTFGEILFEITAEPEDPKMGSTSGGGNYQHGKEIQLTANANYGYVFDHWEDGNTDDPRQVTVTEAHHYVAVFRSIFDIKIEVKSEAGEHSVLLHANTTPEDAPVEWGTSEKYSIKEDPNHPGDTHWRIVTLIDKKLNDIYKKKKFQLDPENPRDEKNIEYHEEGNVAKIIATVYLDIGITASIEDHSEYRDSKTIRVKPSTTVQYAMYNNGTTRYYYKEIQKTNPVTTTTNNHFRRWEVPYSIWKSKAEIPNEEKYGGSDKDKHPQGGVNCSGEAGRPVRYPKEYGSWGAEVLAFLDEQNGEKKDSSDFYDYYIYSIK